jgi:hypothetical protein
MLSIAQTPPETFFAGNPVLFRLNTGNAVSSAARRCEFMIAVSAADIVPGHTLTFAFPNKSIVFTTAAMPDDSGYQIQTSVNPAYYDTWAQVLFDSLQSNFEFSSMFVMAIFPAAGGMRIMGFSAKIKGAASTPVITTTIVTAVVTFFAAGADAINRNLFAIIGGIWDKNFRQLSQDIKPVDDEGDAQFNFSEYLSVFLDNDTSPRFTWPFVPSEIIQSFQNYALPFYAGFAERYDGTVRKIHFDTLRNAFPGGLNRETIVAYNAAGKEFFSVAENLLSFMTWAPNTKLTSKTTPELLFFYATSKPPFADFDLVVAVYFTDGTTDQFIIHCDRVDANDVFEFSVGYEHLTLAARFPTKTVSKWIIGLSNQGIHLDSERRTFILDHKFYENERVFIFQNSYGRAYDVIRLTGQGSTDIDVEYSTSNSDIVGVYTSFNAPVSKFGTSEVQKMKCNTGWITRETKDYLRELLLSKQVFEYKNGSLFPVIITNDKMKEYFADNQYLYDLEISYDRAYRDFFFQDI